MGELEPLDEIVGDAVPPSPPGSLGTTKVCCGFCILKPSFFPIRFALALPSMKKLVEVLVAVLEEEADVEAPHQLRDEGNSHQPLDEDSQQELRPV